MGKSWTFYFYDLETSGINAATDRILQFGGQRTDEDLKPIGKPHNLFVKLPEDVLPEPEAILVHGITPQQTLQDGMSEAEFVHFLDKEVFKPDTIMLGFNSIRFDDEFIRHALYRSFNDPYEREYKEQRSRWDIIDLVRMTRALRPEGVQWPTDEEGKPTNRLEALAKANKLQHDSAHDALSDVQATLTLAQLIKKTQPKLFEHLLKVRLKGEVSKLVSLENPKPFVHTSDMLSSDFLKTSIVVPIAPHPTNPNGMLVYDLRYDPTEFVDLDVSELAKRAFTRRPELEAEGLKRLPVKGVFINRSPAVAPLGVLDDASQKRIKLTIKQAETHLKSLTKLKGFGQRVHEAWETQEEKEYADPDQMLYSGGFFDDHDRRLVSEIAKLDADGLADLHPKWHDGRLDTLLLRYKARNFPEALSGDERKEWDQYRLNKFSGKLKFGLSMQQFMNRLTGLAEQVKGDQQFLLEELQLYAESIMPFETEQLL